MSSWNRTRVIRRLPLVFVPALLAFAIGHAQGQQAPATLTLDDAIRLARQNNPAFRMQANDASVADWSVAESMANLLPDFRLGSGFTYQPAGKPQGFGNFTAEDLGISETPPYYLSNYNLSLSLGLSAATFLNIAQQKANRTATDARIVAAGYSLASDVAREYLSALRSKEAIALALKEVESAKSSQRLAATRFEVGEGTKIDVAQADIAVGRAEVALIQAQNLYEMDKLRLLQRIGVNLDRDIELTTTLEVFEPQWTREELMAIALARHPQVHASRANEAASKSQALAAKSAYLPSVFLSAGWGGFARENGSTSAVIESARGRVENQRSNCESNNRIRSLLGDPLQNCAAIVFTPDMEQLAVQTNNQFPFNWTSNTPSFSLSVSIPVFDGLTRERQMQQARAAADDAKHQRREAELTQQTLVATTFLTVQAAYRSVLLQQRIKETAASQLELARERYRLGAGTFVDLSVAEALKARADQDHLAAVFTFHENVAALESAVGQTLRR